MLTMTAEVLSASTEKVNWDGGSFDSTTLKVLSGEGASVSIDYVRLGRDFDKSKIPAAGDHVSLEVVTSAYVNKQGKARVQLTAVGLAPVGLRVASA